MIFNEKTNIQRKKKKVQDIVGGSEDGGGGSSGNDDNDKKSGIKHDKMRRAQKTGEEAKRYVGEFDWTPKRVSERVYARRMYA